MTDTYTAADVLDELEDAWAFDNGQQHLHTWHDKRDFIDKWRKRLHSSLHPAPPRVPTDEDRGKRVRAWDVSSPTPYDSPESDGVVEGVLEIRSKQQGFYVQDDSGHIHQRSHAELIDPPADPNSEQKMQDAVSAVLGEPAGKVRQPRFGSPTPPPADEQQPAWRDATEADDGFLGEIELKGVFAQSHPLIEVGTLRVEAESAYPYRIEFDEVNVSRAAIHARILANPVDAAGEGEG